MQNFEQAVALYAGSPEAILCVIEASEEILLEASGIISFDYHLIQEDVTITDLFPREHVIPFTQTVQ